ncbi:MAG TPA: hypothetical protein VIG25_07440 [Pyrinomonadaceae bacterium]|jgi:hypothetical protein
MTEYGSKETREFEEKVFERFDKLEERLDRLIALRDDERQHWEEFERQVKQTRRLISRLGQH